MSEDLDIDVNIYDDLENILFRGFLTHGFVYNDIPYRFKSLTEPEFTYINDKWFHITDIETKFKYFLAFSVLEINTENLLPYRHENEFVTEMLGMITSWPQEFYFKVSKLIDIFRERQSYSSKLLEAYTYTDESRMLWANYKGMFLNSPEITGYPGTNIFPLGSLQKSWVYINYLEDLRIRSEQLNDMGRVAGSAANPEGMKDYNSKETNRRNQLKLYREQVKQNAGYATSEDFSGTMSSEELVEQLHRAQRGEKDEHDLMVEKYELNLKRQQLEEKKKLLELMNTQKQAVEEARFNGIRVKRELLTEAPEAENNILGNVPVTDKSFGAGNARYSLMSPDAKTKGKYSAMAKLSDEEEELLNSDLLEEHLNNVNNLTIKEDVVRGPRLEDYRKG